MSGAVGFLNDVVTLARERIAAAKKEVVDSYVRGHGAAAARLRGAFKESSAPIRHHPSRRSATPSRPSSARC
ncbi:MAG: hypothetical protein IJK04_07220 [Kiritimatiellae bacterium]|nr:hypothetical protein [Kiritimatiellia bacterium]